MKIFIDIGHPAHVHYFRNFIKDMEKKGHSFFITARDKEMTQYLLDKYKIQYRSRGTGSNSFIGKLVYLFYADFVLFFSALKYKPDLFFSFMSPYASHIAKLTNKPHIAFDDTEHAKFGKLLYEPFTDLICTPVSYRYRINKVHVKFNSYMELSYLHPSVFKPSRNILNELGIEKNEKYTIIRFVAWNANHDRGHSGISNSNKINAVNQFLKFGKVFITSEVELPNELKDYELKISPEKIHDFMAFASLLYGESATMASESAVLGIPAVFHDNIGRGYTSEQERNYSLVYNFSESEEDQLKGIEKGVKILSSSDNLFYKNKHQMLLNDRFSLTRYMCWLITNYPESKKLLIENRKSDKNIYYNAE